MIKVIFLDMGGVLVNHSKKDQIKLLMRYSGKSFEECRRIREKYADKSKIGKITDEEYWLGASKLKGWGKGVLAELGISKDKYPELRNLTVEVNKLLPGSEEFLKKLNKAYILILLSNNTFDWGEKILADSGYEKYFDGIVFSFKVGLAKPGEEIFNLAIEKTKGKIKGNDEVLFIDDKKSNLKTAKKLGLQALQFKTYGQVLSFLNKGPRR